MEQTKETKEVENLLALILQSGQMAIRDGQLLVPSAIAQRYGDQIRKLKPAIMITLGHCPECGEELVVKVEDLGEKPRRHAHCQTAGHYDKWES